MAAVNEKSVPTASQDMLQPTTISNRNELTNGAIGKFHKSHSKDRVRSKSESQHHAVDNLSNELVGVVVKSSKDRSYDRKPRNLKGNGKPKKGGGGGKGTWGKNGEVYDEEQEADPNDPNFDPDTVKNNDIIMTEVVPDLTSTEFDHVVTPLIQEYYDHTITSEVCIALKELNISHLKHRIVLLVVSMAMEKKGCDRELTSVLISDLYGQRILYEQDIELGFQALMNVLDDLKLDTPDAPSILGQFIARCVADDCLNPCYVKEHLQHPTPIAKEALETAHRFLDMKHGLVRLDSIWGFGGGIRPVKLLIKEIILLIKEFLSSGDLKEAERCVVDLDVPHFHHEIVYEVLIIALESGSALILEKLKTLLKHFSDSTMVSDDQMKVGFQRLYENMDDIVLDVPRAHKHLESFLVMCCRAGVIALTLKDNAPMSGGRKRYVSEGDFGVTSTSGFLH